MNKRMYKLELLCVKYVPIIIAAIVLLNAILARFDVYVDELNYIAGTSFLTLIPMYISSIVYKFCKYHRMFILHSNSQDCSNNRYVHWHTTGRWYVTITISNYSRYFCFSCIISASKVWGKEE